MDRSRKVRNLDKYVSIWSVIKKWPSRLPLFMLGGDGRFAILPVAFDPISKDKALGTKISHIDDTWMKEVPFVSGVMGVLSYSDYSQDSSDYPSVFYHVKSALIFDQIKEKIFLTGDYENLHAQYMFDVDLLKNIEEIPFPREKGFSLRCLHEDGEYLRNVNSIISDIRSGRYYQINYLRYFDVDESVDVDSILSRFHYHGGPHSAWLKHDDLEIVSFSPERFVQVVSKNGRLIVKTFPIKGTLPVLKDTKQDLLQIDKLGKSKKDLAELHMIVDLMRNDMNRISEDHSVRVVDTGSVHSFTNVHHLIAHVESQLVSDITCGRLFDILCPGGSITGAPKIEAMKAIYEYEKRPRGWFMGNAFYLDEKSGHMDSSILIRTMVRSGCEKFEFAAGGGIVIESDPLNEMKEVEAKSRILTSID